MKTAYLFIGYPWLELLVRVNRHIRLMKKRQQCPSIIRILIKSPAIMEHILGTPLIGKVLQQVINKRHHRISWNYLSMRKFGIKTANNGGGITHRLQFTRRIWH